MPGGPTIGAPLFWDDEVNSSASHEITLVVDKDTYNKVWSAIENAFVFNRNAIDPITRRRGVWILSGKLYNPLDVGTEGESVHCTTWPVDILQAAGIDFGWKGGMLEPADLLDLPIYHKFGRPVTR